MADHEEFDAPDLDMDKEGGEAIQDVKVEEHLATSQRYGQRKVWLVKVPKFLQERWAEQSEAGVHLATMRVYNATPGGKRKITLVLPEEAQYPTDDLPNEFDLNMAADENEEGDKKRKGFVLSERKIEAGRVHPTLYSQIAHEASLQPNLHAPKYRALLRKRQELAAKPKRTLMRLDEDKLGAGQVAQMASGVAVSAAEKGKGRFQVKKPPPRALDKNTRLPRNELLDLIFSLFETHQYWTLKGLKEKTRQPETYLKETMSSIAVMQKRGPYTGTWALMDMYKPKVEDTGDGGAKKEEPGVKGEGVVGDAGFGGGAVASGSGGGAGGYGAQEMEDGSDDEGSDDEDMEEV